MNIEIYSNVDGMGNDDLSGLFSHDDIDSIKYISPPSWHDKIVYIALKESESIIGVVSLQKFDMSVGVIDGVQIFWAMTACSINPKFQGKGYARKLVQIQFDVMKEIGIEYIMQSSYSSDGMQKIYHIYQEYIDSNDISYLDKGNFL